MRKRIGQLSASLPWGFLGALAMVVVIECLVVRPLPLYPEPGGLSWQHTARAAKRMAAGRQILCFGDSLVNTAVLPVVLEGQTGLTAYNLAVHNGSPVASYYALRHAVDAGARPGAVILDFEKNMLRQGPASRTQAYPWSELLSFRDALELAWVARDAELFADLAVKRLVRSAAIRREIRQAVSIRLGGATPYEWAVVLANRRNFNRNLGSFVHDKNPKFEDMRVVSGSAEHPEAWRSDRVNAVYIRRFLQLAQSIDARVYLLLPPASPGFQSWCDYCGVEDQFTRFVRRLQDSFPGLVVLDARHCGFGSDVFIDISHLDRDGAPALAELVGGAIRDDRGATPGSKWVQLRGPSHPSRRWPVETVSDSHAFLRSGATAATVTR